MNTRRFGLMFAALCIVAVGFSQVARAQTSLKGDAPFCRGVLTAYPMGSDREKYNNYIIHIWVKVGPNTVDTWADYKATSLKDPKVVPVAPSENAVHNSSSVSAQAGALIQTMIMAPTGPYGLTLTMENGKPVGMSTVRTVDGPRKLICP